MFVLCVCFQSERQGLFVFLVPLGFYNIMCNVEQEAPVFFPLNSVVRS